MSLQNEPEMAEGIGPSRTGENALPEAPRYEWDGSHGTPGCLRANNRDGGRGRICCNRSQCDRSGHTRCV